MQCAPLLYWLIVTEMRTHWPRTPDARHVSNVRNRQHNTQRRYLLHLALIVLYRVLFFPILTSSNIPSRRACPRSPPLIIFLGPAECTTAHCPHRGCTLFIIHFDEYFDLWCVNNWCRCWVRRPWPGLWPPRTLSTSLPPFGKPRQLSASPALSPHHHHCPECPCQLPHLPPHHNCDHTVTLVIASHHTASPW